MFKKLKNFLFLPIILTFNIHSSGECEALNILKASELESFKTKCFEYNYQAGKYRGLYVGFLLSSIQFARTSDSDKFGMFLSLIGGTVFSLSMQTFFWETFKADVIEPALHHQFKSQSDQSLKEAFVRDMNMSFWSGFSKASLVTVACLVPFSFLR